MKNTPSALKWLAETRARLAHDLAESCRIQTAVLERTAKLEADLAALDRSLTVYDARLAPDAIQPVRGHRPDYGKRGNLTAAMASIAASTWPGTMTAPSASMGLTAFNGCSVTSPARRLTTAAVKGLN